MAFHSDRPLRRALGSAFGVSFLAVGAGAMGDIGGWADTPDGGRVFWYGGTACLIGMMAIVGSWTVRDPDTIWCRHPRHPVMDAEKAVTKPISVIQYYR